MSREENGENRPVLKPRMYNTIGGTGEGPRFPFHGALYATAVHMMREVVCHFGRSACDLHSTKYSQMVFSICLIFING